MQETIARGKSLPVGHEKPGTYIEIWDKAGKVLPEGEQGEIVIIGDTVSCGYYMRADLTKKAFSIVSVMEKLTGVIRPEMPDI